MTHAMPVDFARHAWDFRDAAMAAERVLGERDEYQLNASLPVACLFGLSIELALRSYILSRDASLTQIASPDRRHDLERLFNEASKRGLLGLVRTDGQELRMLSALARLCSTSPLDYVAIRGEEVPFFDPMRNLCDKLLEVAGAMAGYERTACE